MSLLCKPVLVAAACLVTLARASSSAAPLKSWKVTKERLIKKDFECGSNDRFIGKINSPGKCAIIAGEKGASYFSYGKVDESIKDASMQEKALKAQNCYIEYVDSDDCPQGWEGNGTYDFYAIDEYEATPVLLKHGYECKSDDHYIGMFDGPQQCAEETMKKEDGQFFIYGYGFKMRKCYYELTKDHTCPEGLSSNSYDFYGVQLKLIRTAQQKRGGHSGTKLTNAEKLHSGKECGSSDEYVGWFTDVSGCANEVKGKSGKYFSYGQSFSTRTWLCYMEHTNSSDCPEGLQENSFDFYKVKE